MCEFTLRRLQGAAREQISQLKQDLLLISTTLPVSDTQHSGSQSSIHILLQPCQDILGHELILPSSSR